VIRWGLGSLRKSSNFGGTSQPIQQYREYLAWASYSLGGSSDAAFCCQYCSNLLLTMTNAAATWHKHETTRRLDGRWRLGPRLGPVHRLRHRCGRWPSAPCSGPRRGCGCPATCSIRTSHRCQVRLRRRWVDTRWRTSTARRCSTCNDRAGLMQTETCFYPTWGTEVE